MGHGISDRGEWWNDRCFANAPDSIRMIGIGHFHDHRIEHRQVQADGHTIIQEAAVEHVALGVEDIFFVEGPANALRGTALDLSLDITGMDRLASILHRRVAQNGNFASLRVYLHIDNVGAHRRPGARWVDPGAPDNRATRGHLTSCNLFEGETTGRIRGIPYRAVRIRDLLDRDLPGFGGALTHLAFDVLS